MNELRLRARRVVAGVAADDPDVVSLAQYVALALTVDRALLRAARREALPQRGPDIEADLWHSPLVASTGAAGIVFDRAVRDELRIGLRAKLTRYEAAFKLVEHEHGWLPDTLRLEEWLAFQALMPGGAQRVRQRLAEVEAQVEDRPGLEPWLDGLHARLPAPVGGPDGAGPGGERVRAGRGGDADAAGTRVDVRLLDGAVEFRAGTPSRAWHAMTLPAHAPPLVHVGEQLVDLDELPLIQPVAPGAPVAIEALDGSGVRLGRSGRGRPERRPSVLRGHRGWVRGVAWSPDGRLVVSGGGDGVVRVWEVASGREVVAFAGHERAVRGVAWSPDGRLVVSCAADGVVRVWEVASGGEVVAFAGHEGGVWAVAWSPDGRLVVSGGDDGVVRVWEVASGREVVAFAGHGGGVWAVAWSPDGRLVVSGGDDGVVRVWEVASGREVAAFAGHEGGVWGVAWSPDGRLVVSGGDDGVVRVWEVASGREVVAFAGHERGVWGLAWSPDGRLVVSGGLDGVVRVWEVASGREVVAFASHGGGVREVAWSPDGRLVVSGGLDGVVRVWEVAPAREVVAFAGHERGARGVAWSPDGRLVVSGGVDGVVRVWELASGREVVAFAGHGGGVRGVAWSPDGRLVVSGGFDGVVRVWEVASGREVVAFAGHEGGVRGVAWSPDGRLVVSGGADGVVRVWEVASGREVVAFAGHMGWVQVWGVAWSPDGRLVVSGGDDRVVRVWEVASGREVAAFAGHEGRVWGVAWSPDGRLVVSCDVDRVVRVWEVASGRKVAAFAGHEGGVFGVAWSPDGRLVVSCGGDGVVRVWEVASGSEVVAFAGHTGGVWGVAWSPDGRLVASGGDDGVVRVRDVGAPASAVLRGAAPSACALAGAARELRDDRLRWALLLGIGGGALPAALLAAGHDGARVRDLLVSQDLAHPLATPPRRSARARRRRPRDQLERRIAAALAQRDVHGWRDLAVASADPLHASVLQLALLDVASGRVVILPRDAGRLGIDLDAVPVERLVVAAAGGVGGSEVTTVAGRRLASALGQRIDLRPVFGDQPHDQPAVLVDAGPEPHPRWVHAAPFTSVAIPVTAGSPQRWPSRPQREVLALVGADAARRATAGRSLADLVAGTARVPAPPPIAQPFRN